MNNMHNDTGKKILEYPGSNIKRLQIANKINSLHFQGKTLLVSLKHKDYAFSVTLEAYPHVCHGGELRVSWKTPDHLPKNLIKYMIDRLIIPGNTASLELVPDSYTLDSYGITSKIPEETINETRRRINRNECQKNLAVCVVQAGLSFSCLLLDYTPEAFKVQVSFTNRESAYWINLAKPIDLIIAISGKVIHSGSCVVVRQSKDDDYLTLILSPVESNIPRYKPKIKRTKRFVTAPSFDITFVNPLTGKNVKLPVRDISSMGLSLTESLDTSVLFPSLILDDVELLIFENAYLRFKGQLIYRRIENDNTVVCGLAILDISTEDHYKLIALVHKAEDDRSYVSINKDPLDFFDFLFESGFIYSGKYQELSRFKDDFINSYNKLYQQDNDIARCFVYVENGRIYGHVSALRVFKYTWLNHHHAAITKKQSGLKVLRQISDFHNDSYVLNPLFMRYIVGIWRPDNSFPARFFGSFAKNTKDHKMCSVDTFTYCHLSSDSYEKLQNLKGLWEVLSSDKHDLHEFGGFYERISGGLLASAYDLTPDRYNDDTIANVYQACQLKRRRFVYTIRFNHEIVALIDIQDSDHGLNLSDLTNAIYAYVLDQDTITTKDLLSICDFLAKKHDKEGCPLMVFPESYILDLPAEQIKKYTVWILNTEYSDAYMKHIERWCR